MQSWLTQGLLAAKLYRAVFDDAVLCGVNFTGANLDFATFWNSFIDQSTFESLGNTAWWLAKGLGADQLRILSNQKPVELSQSPAFIAEREKAEERVVNTPPGNNLARVDALNNLAWKLAISRVDVASKSSTQSPTADSCGPDDRIPSTAQDAATQSLCIVDHLIGSEKENEYLIFAYRPAIEDTLGYILLQAGKIDSALKYLKEASEKTPETDQGEILFRLSVAESAKGDPQAAADMKKSFKMGYMPTHELGTLARFLWTNPFNDEFYSALRELYPELKRAGGCKERAGRAHEFLRSP